MLESAYLSKRPAIHPGNLAEVAARWHCGLEPMRRPSGMVRLSRGFWLASIPVDSIAAFKVRGLVWSCGCPVQVILEFAEWSKTESEVGVFPRSLLWPANTARYRRRVMAALQGMSHVCLRARTRPSPRANA